MEIIRFQGITIQYYITAQNTAILSNFLVREVLWKGTVSVPKTLLKLGLFTKY